MPQKDKYMKFQKLNESRISEKAYRAFIENAMESIFNGKKCFIAAISDKYLEEYLGGIGSEDSPVSLETAVNWCYKNLRIAGSSIITLSLSDSVVNAGDVILVLNSNGTWSFFEN